MHLFCSSHARVAGVSYAIHWPSRSSRITLENSLVTQEDCGHHSPRNAASHSILLRFPDCSGNSTTSWNSCPLVSLEGTLSDELFLFDYLPLSGNDHSENFLKFRHNCWSSCGCCGSPDWALRLVNGLKGFCVEFSATEAQFLEDRDIPRIFRRFSGSFFLKNEEKRKGRRIAVRKNPSYRGKFKKTIIFLHFFPYSPSILPFSFFISAFFLLILLLFLNIFVFIFHFLPTFSFNLLILFLSCL